MYSKHWLINSLIKNAMKKSIKSIIMLCITCMAIAGKAQQVIVTDDAGYTEPASGAMLDVKSTSKGFMPPRVALTSLTDISTVASPAAGLMVYNTGTGALKAKGIYYWNDTIWTKPLTGGTNSTNYLAIADDGTVSLNGTAATYDDLRVDGSRVQNSGVTAPDFEVFIGGLYCNFFADSKVQSVYFNVQMPHAWKQGTDLGAHVHWTTRPGDAAPGANRVVWGIEYQWVNIAENHAVSNPPISTGSITINLNGTLDAGEHAITPIGTISGTGKTLSSVLVCRVFRNGGASDDNYTGKAALLSIDFHYQIDSFGSSSEYVK